MRKIFGCCGLEKIVAVVIVLIYVRNVSAVASIGSYCGECVGVLLIKIYTACRFVFFVCYCATVCGEVYKSAVGVIFSFYLSKSLVIFAIFAVDVIRYVVFGAS